MCSTTPGSLRGSSGRRRSDGRAGAKGSKVSTGLVAESVHAGYRGVRVLRGADVTATAGSVALIVGRNGSGKSTLLKAIYGLVPVDEGRIILEGGELTKLRPD